MSMKKYGTSMSGGCLPLLIQMPILFALYPVIQNIPTYVRGVREVYMPVVEQIMATDGFQSIMEKIGEASPILMNPNSYDYSQASTLVNVLYKFQDATWGKLLDQMPGITDIAHNTMEQVTHLNSFLGINIGEQPLTMLTQAFHDFSITGMILAIIIPVMAGLTQFISVKLQPQPASSGNDKDNPMMNSMKTMTYTMPLISVVFGFTLPAGLGLYWVTSALFQCLQQVIINKYMDSVDINILVAKNKEKAAKKKAKGQKTFMEKLMDTSAKADSAKEGVENFLRKKKSIKQIASINTKKIAGPEGTGKEDFDSLSSVDISKLGDIGKKAYMVSQYEKEHGNTRGGKK